MDRAIAPDANTNLIPIGIVVSHPAFLKDGRITISDLNR